MSEALARRFHEAYERLAPQFGYATRPETREFDPQSPNGKLMIAVCAEVFGAELAHPAAVLAHYLKALSPALDRCPDCEFFGGDHDVECPRAR